MATRRTVEGEYLSDLIEKFSNGNEVIKVGAPGIVSFVENEVYSRPEEDVRDYIEKSVKELKDKNVDSVVLGCTHFIHVSNEIQRALGDNVTLVDSREGVSNQVKRVLGEPCNKCHSESFFYLTSEIEDIDKYKRLCVENELIFKGVI